MSHAVRHVCSSWPKTVLERRKQRTNAVFLSDGENPPPQLTLAFGTRFPPATAMAAQPHEPSRSSGGIRGAPRTGHSRRKGSEGTRTQCPRCWRSARPPRRSRPKPQGEALGLWPMPGAPCKEEGAAALGLGVDSDFSPTDYR